MPASGCSQGANSMDPVKTLVRALKDHRQEVREVRASQQGQQQAEQSQQQLGPLSVMVYHEDLPGQDWACLFELLESKSGNSYVAIPQYKGVCAAATVGEGGAEDEASDGVHVFPAAIGRTFYERLFPDK